MSTRQIGCLGCSKSLRPGSMPWRWTVTIHNLLLGVFLAHFLALSSSQQQCPAAEAPQSSSKWPHNSTSPGHASQEGCEWRGGGYQFEAPAQQEWKYDAEPVPSQFIVRFRDYKMAPAHKQALAEGLGMGEHWKYLDRNNAAAKFPTDFALIEIDLKAIESVKELLSKLPFVKDVHPEQRVKRSLVWAGEEECEQHSGSLCDVGPHQHINKRPGRFSTKPSQGLHNNGSRQGGSRRLMADRSSVVSKFSAELLWNEGYRGELVKMGVFDTGIRLDHPHVKHIRERTNWTHEPTLEDGLGHGTFVAGVIGGTDASCPGFAPEVELYTFRVFTNDQVSYTSWFLDAFNYAIGTEMNVVNLSIGGPDYLDLPFVEKVWEITSSGILMVSAIGNDGPLYGTLNNPADQNDVIGVGGIDYADKIASFSSRGMSTWELPRGYGRAKPDVVAYGRDVMGSRIQGGCRSLSGTSVASPVVAGAVCLLASTVPVEKRWHFSGGILNPASMKQALVEGAVPIPGISMYEQGQGKLDLARSKAVLQSYVPRASIVPDNLDFTQCPFMWPFCIQPIYAHAMPLMFNATVLNGMGLTGEFEAEPLYVPKDDGGKLLDVRFEHSDLLWPWSGFLALYVYVRPEGEAFNGTASGEISFTIVSPPMPGESEERKSKVKLPITVAIIPTPSRERRILWDQFHSLRYPPAYLPRDSLDVRNDILDWHGDHPHTNYHELYGKLRETGYFLEILGSPLTCFDASQYGTLLIVDSEEEFYPEEVTKLHRDVEQHGLGVVVFADWYNVDTMVKMRFFDDNTRSWWMPITGGSNVPALNDLLAVFGISFGDALLEGQMTIGEEKIYYASGVNIVRFPAKGILHSYQLSDKATVGLARTAGSFGSSGNSQQAVLGFTEHGDGRVAVYGDSNCLDSSHQRSSCHSLLLNAIRYVAEGKKAPELFDKQTPLKAELGSKDSVLPQRRTDIDLTPFSTVLSQPLVCSPNSPLDFEQRVLPHRGATHSERLPAITKIKEDPIVTNLHKLEQSEEEGEGEAAGVKTEGKTFLEDESIEDTEDGPRLDEEPESSDKETVAASDTPSPPPPGLKRFTGGGLAGDMARAAQAATDSNEASDEDANYFLDSSKVRQDERPKEEGDVGKGDVGNDDAFKGAETLEKIKHDEPDAVSGSAGEKGGDENGGMEAQATRGQRLDVLTGATRGSEAEGAGETDGGDSQDTVSHNDVIKMAEQRKEASDTIKAAVREDAERQQEIPAWENDAGSLIDPRNRVGEEATKIMDEKKQTDKEVVNQIAASQEVKKGAEPKMGVHEGSRQDKKHKERLESRIMIQKDIEMQNEALQHEEANEDQPKPKSAKYDSIDPLAAREAGNPQGTMFLETSSSAQQQTGSSDAYISAEDLRPHDVAPVADPWWRRVVDSLVGFPQGLAVLGVIGIFVLWHVRRRRRSLDSVPLKDRGKSTKVVTLNMLGLGTDTSSIKSRQRQNLERSTTLG